METIVKPIEHIIVQYQRVENMPESPVWITAFGRRIPVRKMSTGHIIACIHCWNGTGNMRISNDYLGGREKWLKIFSDELVNRN